MGSTAHATKYHSLSRCFVNTNLPPTNAYSAYSRAAQDNVDEMKSDFSTSYVIPWRYKSTNYKPRREGPSYATDPGADYGSKSDLSYSDYARKNVALASRQQAIRVPVSVKVTVTQRVDPRKGRSDYQLYQEELKSYKPPSRYTSRVPTSDLLTASELKQKEAASQIDIGIKKIKIVDNETYSRLLTPTWRKYSKASKTEVDAPDYSTNDLEPRTAPTWRKYSKASKTDVDAPDYSTNDLEPRTPHKLSRSISTSSLKNGVPETLERPLYLSRSSRDTSVYWPGRNCTAKELTNIITEPSHGNYALPFDAFNEVYPGLYLGDMSTALCTKQLRELGVTHVLNAAQKDPGSGQLPGYYVNTSPHYYSRVDIDYLGVPATDVISFDLSPYFEEAADFVDNALATGGKVLVHCHQGISRSATLVLAFLMLKRGMSAQQAMRTVRAKREIIPNSSFLRQLCELNNRLNGGRRRFQDMHGHC